MKNYLLTPFILFLSNASANAMTFNVSADLSIFESGGTLMESESYGGGFNNNILNNTEQQGIINMTALEPFCFPGPDPCPPSFRSIEVFDVGEYGFLTVNAGQLGAKMLFNWDTWYQDTVIYDVWDVIENTNGSLTLISTDSDGDGVKGTALSDGVFQGANISFEITLTPTAVPIPGAFLLFSSGLFALLGLSRRRNQFA